MYKVKTKRKKKLNGIIFKGKCFSKTTNRKKNNYLESQEGNPKIKEKKYKRK